MLVASSACNSGESSSIAASFADHGANFIHLSYTIPCVRVRINIQLLIKRGHHRIDALSY